MGIRIRYLIACGALILGTGGTLAAQGRFGIKAGPSFGDITNKGVLPSNLKTRTGAAAGVFFGTGSALLGFGVEGLYAQRGATSDEAIATAQTRLDYIDVPAYVTVNIPAPGVQPYAYAGPQVSFEVHCGMANGSACPSNSGRKSTDFAGIIGAGVRFGGQSLGLSLEGRYVYGLSDLKLSTVSSSESYKTRTFMLLIGIGR